MIKKLQNLNFRNADNFMYRNNFIKTTETVTLLADLYNAN